jgi:glutamine synthetase
MVQVTKSLGFIAKHGLWTDEQRRQAEDLKRRIETDNLHLVRLAWADPHGASRAKALTAPGFLAALINGHNINVATSTLDSANARTFDSFTRGGGMGLDEMTGSPNLTVVPDPSTFRVLPWAPGVGWVMGDEYFNSGVPFHFSPRQLLRKQLKRLAEKGMSSLVGLEIEWYLLRVADDHLTHEHIGIPGARGRPIGTWPVEPGFSYHSESNMDLMQPVLSTLATRFDEIGLPLRSIENEFGPGQVECTFAPRPALEAADHALLFRTATRQICRRMGFLATFMCRPALKGFYSSGWHLHQSLVDAKSGRNLFMPEDGREYLSPMGLAFLGGLMKHAGACTPFATPTVNGYRRYRPNSLAPDRATWCYDHRGVMIRVLGGPDDPDGEPDRRAFRESLSLYPVADRGRARWHRQQARAGITGRRSLQCQPAHAARKLAGRLGCARARTAISCPTRRCLRRLLPQAQAQRGRQVRAVAQGYRRAGGRRADGMGAERVFRFFLGGCIIASCEQGRS